MCTDISRPDLNEKISQKEIKYVIPPKILTSYHLFEIVFYVSEKIGDDWAKKVNLEINEKKILVAELLERRCKDSAEFFNQKYAETDMGCGCIMTPDNESYWGYPNVHYKCAQDIREGKNSFFAICFGKFDIIGVQPLPHSYWSSLMSSFLTSKGDMFSESINIPTLRIKYEAEEVIEKVINKELNIESEKINCIDEKTNIRLEFPIVLITFLKFRNDVFRQRCDYSKDCQEKKEDKPKCSRGDNLQEFYWKFGKSLRKKYSKNRIELFLTFSLYYPAIIKAEFNNFKEVEQYLKTIRKRRDIFLETSTVLGINPKYMKTDSDNITDFAQKETAIRFVLLCKINLQQDPEEKVGQEIEDILINNNVIINEEGKSRHIERYSSGYYWDIKISFSTQKIMELINVYISKIKILPGIKKSVIYPTWESTDDNSALSSESSEHDIFQCPNVNKIERFWNWNNNEIYKRWEDIFNRFPRFPYKGKNNEIDIMNMRFYNIKFNLEWLTGYLAQLEQCWFSSEAPQIDTFIIMRETLSNMMKEIDIWLSILEIPAFYGRFGFCNEAKFIQQQKGGNVFDIMIKSLWSNILKMEMLMTSLKFVISSLMVEYNERNEGREVTVVSGPYIRFAERAGLVDLVCGAVNSLFFSYCGFPEEKELLRLKWNGLVSISTGHDFEIFPLFRTLFLPADFLCHVHQKLPLLAHEAGHFIFANLPQKSDAYESFESSIWRKTYDEAEKEINNILRLFEKDDVFKWKIEEVKSYLSRERDELEYSNSEVFIDIFAGLVAGPKYFCSLMGRGFCPSIFHIRDWRHPEMMLRVLMGKMMGKYFSWENDLWGLNSIWENIETHNPYIKDQIDYVEKDIIDPRKLKDPMIIREGKNYLLDPTTYLTKAIIKNPHVINDFKEWVSKHFNNLFFDNYQNNAKTTYDVCKEISKRISWGSEIVLDKPLKYISAASVIDPLCKPYYPSGRILLSIFYSKLFNMQP